MIGFELVGRRTTDRSLHCSGFYIRGSFTNYVDKVLTFFDHLTSSVDTFYLINIDEKLIFLNYLPLVNIVCE